HTNPLSLHDALPISEEATFATNQSYVTCANGACETSLPGFQLSDTVAIAMTGTAGANPSFTGTSNSTSGSGKTFSYDSTLGGMRSEKHTSELQSQSK